MTAPMAIILPKSRLDVACNDPDNGIFAHVAEQLQVTTWDGEDIEFECQKIRPPRFAELPGAIRLCRRRWPILGSIEWYGNWCWNAYWLHPGVLIELLAAAKQADAFHCSQGPTSLYDNWNDTPTFDRTLWAANLWGRHSIGEVA